MALGAKLWISIFRVQHLLVWHNLLLKNGTSGPGKSTNDRLLFHPVLTFCVDYSNSKAIFPPPEDAWSALNLTPLDQVKVVIVGQDPYHGPNQAHGLCFSVRKGVQVPPSLRNVYKELVQDKKIENFDTKPTHGFLERWASKLLVSSVDCFSFLEIP
jgi:uracil-DNA glycosylase